MFGIRKKTASKTSYPETFFVAEDYFMLTNMDGVPGGDALAYELVGRLDPNRPYNGRYLSLGRIELEEFKGLSLKSCYFSTRSPRY